ncbi:MAG: molybdopterin-dependent oxidoreductase [Ferrovum sp.]|nr:molybdopterin-dependent oxidoreductase [Ferrovum sp.]NDU86903.1 molybdopterin-dependent oxidoreductase [Ferrovum sp.]
MSMGNMDRRDFLRVLGISGAAATLAGCGNTAIESGVEEVMSYVQPQDFVVPGIGVFYASTCTQCGSGCGIMGKVREGRVLKLEGNPESAISAGKICGLGQAAVQAHYNPDRLRTPMMRSEGGLIPVSWDKATQMLEQRLGPTSTLKGDQIAFLTGDISGHQRVLLENFLESYDSTHHVLYDAISRVTGQAASKAVLGAEQPLLNIDKARLILSFGNDFLGAGVSPVHMAAQYAKFRKAPRGTLIQIEPRMTLTGGNADRWYPIKPGTEGILALGIAHDLLQHEEFAKGVPDEVHALVKQYDQASVSEITGIGADAVHLIAGQLWNNSPSLVIAGPGAEGHAYGFSNVVAIQLLNVILANRGKTIEGQAEHPFPQLAPLQGGYRALAKLHEQMASGQCQALLIHGTNPVFTSPSNLPFADSMEKVPFKVAFVTHLDETAGNCDLVLPLLSAMEDFGTHVADYQPNGVELMVQQPLMEKLYPESRGFGDILLDILKKRKPDSYTAFPDYYSYIKTAVVKAKPVFKVTDSDDHFWEDALRKGVIKWEGKPTALEAKLSLLEVPKPRGLEADYPFYFVPSVRPDMRDGRHAYLPWLQESPETMTTIVWDSWVEIHPKTAAEMQIREGDVLVVQSATGSVRAVAYIFPGIQPDTVSMPLGQGHTQLGRFATGVGVNPYKILDPVFDAHTGELALHATRVTLRKTGENQNVVKDEGPTNFQNGHKLVATLDADQAKLSKEI